MASAIANSNPHEFPNDRPSHPKAVCQYDNYRTHLEDSNYALMQLSMIPFDYRATTPKVEAVIPLTEWNENIIFHELPLAAHDHIPLLGKNLQGSQHWNPLIAWGKIVIWLVA